MEELLSTFVALRARWEWWSCWLSMVQMLQLKTRYVLEISHVLRISKNLFVKHFLLNNTSTRMSAIFLFHCSHLKKISMLVTLKATVNVNDDNDRGVENRLKHWVPYRSILLTLCWERNRLYCLRVCLHVHASQEECHMHVGATTGL